MTDTIKTYTSLSFDEFHERIKSGDVELIKEFGPHGTGENNYIINIDGTTKYFSKGERLVNEEGVWKIVTSKM